MASRTTFEKLPVEISNHILSYLAHPRSRLPGRTEKQSSRDCPEAETKAAKEAYYTGYGTGNREAPPDTDRFGCDLFSWTKLHHPFNALALTSRRCRELTEGFCKHLVRASNRFNLPFPQAEQGGPSSVYPDLSAIVYRRLWLQLAPRYCVFCNLHLSEYPHRSKVPLIACCLECFYNQIFTMNEVEQQYHMSWLDLAANKIRGTPGAAYVLRVDVEALALQLYGTKAFHNPHNNRGNQLCSICAKAGTLVRIMKLKAERKALGAWVEVPGSVGFFAMRKEGSEPKHATTQHCTWPKILPCSNDPSRIQKEDQHIGHLLHLERIPPPNPKSLVER